eukprot:7710-Heterococcus_DN1.PRE.4
MWLPSRKHRKIIQHSFVVPGRRKSVGSVTASATPRSVRKRKSTSSVVPNDAGSSTGGAVGAGVRRKSILTAISDETLNDVSAATGKHAATPKQGILLTGHTSSATNNSASSTSTTANTSSTPSSLAAAEAQLSAENKRKTSALPSSGTSPRRSSAKVSGNASPLSSSASGSNTLHTQSYLSLSGAIAAGRERVQSLTPTKVQQDKLQTLIQAQQQQLQQSGGTLTPAVSLKAARASVVFKRGSIGAKDSTRMHDLPAAIGNHLPHTSETHSFFSFCIKYKAYVSSKR